MTTIRNKLTAGPAMATHGMGVVLAAALAVSVPTPPASAHDFLVRAVPGGGMTVKGSLREIRMWYTHSVVTTFSAVTVTSSTGDAIPTSRPVNDPSDRQIMIVRLGRALGPGTYIVNWRAISIDTHPTTGTFRFTVT
jgi:copper resistance protein C